MMASSRNKSALALRALGIAVSAIPPALAVLSYFPLWRTESPEKLLSGGTLLLLIICAVPLFRVIRKVLRTPAAYIVWLIIFALFYLLSSIADEMTVISFTGFVSNLISAVLFKLSGRCRK